LRRHKVTSIILLALFKSMVRCKERAFDYLWRAFICWEITLSNHGFNCHTLPNDSSIIDRDFGCSKRDIRRSFHTFFLTDSPLNVT
jgi:hypothetical protein